MQCRVCTRCDREYTRMSSRDDTAMLLHDVPRLDARLCSTEEVMAVYARVQVLLLEHAVDVGKCADYGLGHLRQLFTHHKADVLQAWTPEGVGTRSPEEVLAGVDHAGGSRATGSSSDSWYASVILDEYNAPRALAELLAATPRTPSALELFQVEPHAWLFFGRNGTTEPMPGRPEHRDNVKCDGTWHLQLSGSKLWGLRPYPDAIEWSPRVPPDVPSGRLHVLVEAGSALLVNTRLYLHETSVPGPQPGLDALSLSLARDFNTPWTAQLDTSQAAAAMDEAEEHVRGQEFRSVLCRVELCAWCKTPCSRNALGVCGCLCCTMRRGTRGGSSVARMSSDGNDGAPQGALFGTTIPRRLGNLRPFAPNIFLTAARRPERNMPKMDSLRLLQNDGRECQMVQWPSFRKYYVDTRLATEHDDDDNERRQNGKVLRVKVVPQRAHGAQLVLVAELGVTDRRTRSQLANT